MSRTQPQSDRYDAIVVGAGLGGLSAGAFLAKGGRSVLVVERLEGPGGYIHGFRRGDYHIDPAVHAVGGSRPGMIVDTWLRALGVRDRVELTPLPAFYTLFMGGLRIDVPYDVEGFKQAHAARFPGSAAEIGAFVDLCCRIKNEWDQVRPGLSLDELAARGGGLPTVLRYRGSTLAEVLNELVADETVRAALGATWCYLAAPPSRVSFLSFAGMLVSTLQGGESHCVGGFQKLADAFVVALEENGGELVVQREVSRILVHDGQVQGVRLSDGLVVQAPVVVAGGDLTRTLEVLVGSEHLPSAYVDRVRRMKPSLSAFVVYGATRCDVGRWNTAPQNFVWHDRDYDRMLRSIGEGVIDGFSVHFATLAEPRLAPAGEHLFSSIVLAPYDIGRSWRDEKDRFRDAILARIDETFPGVLAGLIFAEASTPLSLERWTLNRGGAVYGWENGPHQTQHRRPANTTPLAGLYVVGHWAHPGSGTIHAIGSGFQAAMQVLGAHDPGAFLETLGATN
jgi:prolycopene isomerase